MVAIEIASATVTGHSDSQCKYRASIFFWAESMLQKHPCQPNHFHFTNATLHPKIRAGIAKHARDFRNTIVFLNERDFEVKIKKLKAKRNMKIN